MKCLYCDSEINEYSLYDLFIESDLLCCKCREKIKYHHQKFKIDDLMVETFYEYDSLFKDLLLQYKECYDEALKSVFIYKIDDYIKIKYLGYQVIYVPSTKTKIRERGFGHLKGIFESLGLKEVCGLKQKSEKCQAGKGYEERLGIQNNFYYEGPKLNKVLIIDDVLTTGSSLMGVYKAIKPYCKKCKAIVLAKT